MATLNKTIRLCEVDIDLEITVLKFGETEIESVTIGDQDCSILLSGTDTWLAIERAVSDKLDSWLAEERNQQLEDKAERMHDDMMHRRFFGEAA